MGDINRGLKIIWDKKQFLLHPPFKLNYDWSLIPVLGDLWLQGLWWLWGVQTYTRTGRPVVAGVAVVSRSTETYTCTGRPMVAGVVVVARSTETYTPTGRPMVAGVAERPIVWICIFFISVEPLLTNTYLLWTVSYVPTRFSLIYFKEKTL